MPSTSEPAMPRLLLAVVASLALGVATSFGQGSSWEVLSAACNSPSTWTLVAAALAATTRRPVLGALLGAISLLGLTFGYYIASLGRGYPVGVFYVLFWALASVVIGPIVGALVARARDRRGLSTALACGVLAGVLVAEGAHVLGPVRETVPGAWGMVCIAGGGVTIAVGAVLERRVRFFAVSLVALAVVGLGLTAVTTHM